METSEPLALARALPVTHGGCPQPGLQPRNYTNIPRDTKEGASPAVEPGTRRSQLTLLYPSHPREAQEGQQQQGGGGGGGHR